MLGPEGEDNIKAGHGLTMVIEGSNPRPQWVYQHQKAFPVGQSKF